MKKPIILLLFIAFGFQALSAVSALSGSIGNAAGARLYLEEYVEGGTKKIDSVMLDKSGKFSFKINHDNIGYYKIHIKPIDFIAVILKPGDKQTIHAKAEILRQSYTVKGSDFSSQVREFSQMWAKYNTDRDSIAARFKRAIAQGKDAESEKLGKDLSKTYDAYVSARAAFIDKYPKSPALFAVSAQLNPDADYDLMKKIEKALELSMPNSFYLKQVAASTKKVEEQRANEEAKTKEAERLKKLKESVTAGKPIPEFAMADTNGILKSVSSTLGKYTLVDFWASWCGPCRAENPNVVRLYNQYKDKGFTVFSVSLDNDKKKWTQAIIKDKLSWPGHVSELKGWQTSVLGIFGITGIPYTILIDKEGKIIQTGLRGPALEAKLKELLGN